MYEPSCLSRKLLTCIILLEVCHIWQVEYLRLYLEVMILNNSTSRQKLGPPAIDWHRSIPTIPYTVYVSTPCVTLSFRMYRWSSFPLPYLYYVLLWRHTNSELSLIMQLCIWTVHSGSKRFGLHTGIDQQKHWSAITCACIKRPGDLPLYPANIDFIDNQHLDDQYNLWTKLDSLVWRTQFHSFLFLYILRGWFKQHRVENTGNDYVKTCSVFACSIRRSVKNLINTYISKLPWPFRTRSPGGIFPLILVSLTGVRYPVSPAISWGDAGDAIAWLTSIGHVCGHMILYPLNYSVSSVAKKLAFPLMWLLPCMRKAGSAGVSLE